MNQFLSGVARAGIEAFALPPPIVEIGSYLVPGQEEIANLRCYFLDQEYVGVDLRHGPGVDCVASVEALPQADASVGTVLALNTFEHVARFWHGFDEIHRVLRSDGMLMVSCPFYFHIHDHPSDYWRFTPEALDMLLQDYPQRILGWQGTRTKPLHVWALAFGEDYRAITETQLSTYRARLSRYAHQPMHWLTRLRYFVGRGICGRRPFIPLLEQNQWEIECRPPLCLTRKRSIPNAHPATSPANRHQPPLPTES